MARSARTAGAPERRAVAGTARVATDGRGVGKIARDALAATGRLGAAG
ncbi:hypothetical protein [Streptomyces sp. NPDC093105]